MSHPVTVRTTFTRVRLLLACAVIMVTLGAGPAWGQSLGVENRLTSHAAVQSDGTVIDESASPVAGTASPVATPVAINPYAPAIDHLLAHEAGVYGVVLMKPDGTVLYRRNAELPFVAASLYKLILLADICRAVEQGVLTLETPIYVDPGFYDEADGIDSYFDVSFAGYDTTVEEALLATGAYSSNVAAKALLTLTTPEDLFQTIDDLGLKSTFFYVNPVNLKNWPPHATADISAGDAETTARFVTEYAYDGEVNLTTPMDIARYFRLLLKGKVIDKFVSKMIRDILSQQMIDNRFPVLLPDGTKIIHKTGNLDFVVHDAGIIYGKDGPVILVALSQASVDEERATEIEQRLALIAYGEFQIPPLTTPGNGDGTAIDDEQEPQHWIDVARASRDSAA